jgi:hypothetical protein
MQSNSSYSTGKMAYQVVSDNNHVLVSVHGEEMYQLTAKATGKVSLVAFESKVAANRFFAENQDYFFSKIN